MIYPMITLIALTCAIAFYLLALRITAVRQGKISIGYFRVYSGDTPPIRQEQAARHYSNLFEVPLLFYITCVTAMTLGIHSGPLLALAWAFVAARLVHSAIHLTYNNVIHRLFAFLTGNLILLTMWVLLALHYGGR
ncbi:MAPEG family protein [Marinimicrobium alkaliphilum]|uniref:MAPEG family protein n=1 Tax=Marinimicrobium alkaliphilum TaxID=2202654 RepID=UPI000DBA1CFB|nr:MAPEG family protein [Marinimicrobium alkaliphilum]